VTGLSYGQEAHLRVGTMIALGVLVAPVVLNVAAPAGTANATYDSIQLANELSLRAH
jgi:hypothetical protein